MHKSNKYMYCFKNTEMKNTISTVVPYSSSLCTKGTNSVLIMFMLVLWNLKYQTTSGVDR